MRVEQSGSSPETENEAAAAAADQVDAGAATQDADTADSSAAGTQDAVADRANLLDVTKKALEGGDKDGDGASSDPDKSKTGDKSSDQSGGDAKDGKSDAETDDDADLPFHKHPRWQEVRAELKEQKERADSFEADATEFHKIEAFRQQANLDLEEVGDGFKVMALIKNDPAKALPLLEGYAADIRKHLGMDLPDDLREAVDQGEITEERARELSQARASTRNLSADADARRAAETERRQAEADQARAGAVEAWEAEARKTDPDFDKKYRRVHDRVVAIMREEGQPRSPEEAVAMTKRAYSEVNDELSQLVPQPRSTTQVPSGVSAAAAARAPKTPVDITRAALGQL